MNKTNGTEKKEIQKKQDVLLDIPENKLTEVAQQRVNDLVDQGRLDLPKDYSVGNAMNTAFLILQNTKTSKADGEKPVLQACTRVSIVQSLFEMAIQGLNPAKKQGYFIAYKDQLTWFTSYFGKQAAISRLKGFEKMAVSTLIYRGDELDLIHDEYGQEVIQNHKTSFENKVNAFKDKKEKNIIGAYCTMKFNNMLLSEVMTYEQIIEAWTFAPGKNEHIKFNGEFAKRTVFNRLAKRVLNTSTDDDLLAETMIANEERHFNFENEDVIEIHEEEVKNLTGKKDIPDVEIVKDPEPESSNETVDTETGEIKQESLFNQDDPTPNYLKI